MSIDIAIDNTPNDGASVVTPNGRARARVTFTLDDFAGQCAVKEYLRARGVTHVSREDATAPLPDMVRLLASTFSAHAVDRMLFVADGVGSVHVIAACGGFALDHLVDGDGMSGLREFVEADALRIPGAYVLEGRVVWRELQPGPDEWRGENVPEWTDPVLRVAVPSDFDQLGASVHDWEAEFDDDHAEALHALLDRQYPGHLR